MSTRHHDVTCRRCAVGYRDTHYHCCICRRVFRSASAYETHQQAAESWDPRIVPTDAKLRRLGLVRNPADVWMRQGSYSRQDAADDLAEELAASGTDRRSA